MAAFELTAGWILSVLGVCALIYPNQAGLLFCRLGKLNWRISTFGLTDMHWFYREEQALRTGRLLAMTFILLGVPWLVIGVLSIWGPNSFAAMNQAQDYLKATYGPSNESSFSCTTAPDNQGSMVVHYEYSGKKGNLLATWDGHKYTFTEQK